MRKTWGSPKTWLSLPHPRPGFVPTPPRPPGRWLVEAVLPDPKSGDKSSGLSSSIPQFLFGLAELESEPACLSCAFWHKPAVVVQKFSSVAPQVRQENFGGFHDPRFTAIGSTKHVRKQARRDGSEGQNRDSSANKAFSSGEAATITRIAPASRSTVATPAEMQNCGTESADISRPAVRTASRKACALRLE